MQPNDTSCVSPRGRDTYGSDSSGHGCVIGGYSKLEAGFEDGKDWDFVRTVASVVKEEDVEEEEGSDEKSWP
jgi:hypothetical protein